MLGDGGSASVLTEAIAGCVRCFPSPLAGLILHQLGDLPGCDVSCARLYVSPPATAPAVIRARLIFTGRGDEAEAETATRRAHRKGRTTLIAVFCWDIFNNKVRLPKRRLLGARR